MVKLN